MRLIFALTGFCLLASAACAASYHWVDRHGFHSVDQLSKVPQEHRLDLPMAQNGTSFPFTWEENRDGAMYVWYILGLAGFDYPYAGAGDIPVSHNFRKVDQPQDGDVAWWKGFVALREGKKGKLLTAGGETTLREIERKRGKAIWYRYQGPHKVERSSDKAPPGIIKQANDSLLPLDKAT